MAHQQLLRSLLIGLGSLVVFGVIVAVIWTWRWHLHVRAEPVAALVDQLELLVRHPPDSASRALLVASLDEVGIRYRYVDAGGANHLVDIHQERLLRIADAAAAPAFSGSATVAAAAVRLRQILTTSW
ncbi:MAG: hypothetical protein RLZZ127_1786 [Planctomycetota bacterium]|jgi:hypothetical protein